ncbi:MAG: hypothetical protein BMS9Abin07_1519 [Acidimicrobiia bacterium]|nr:MAG: hypothetical protein BMS9Abin07_1519 [Acidimicrobiia bacterium]
MDERRSWLRRGWQIGWRVGSLGVAGYLGLGVIVGLWGGICHGAETGWLCVGEFDDNNRESFYVALLASIGVFPFLVLPMTRRVTWLVVAAVVGFVVTLLLVVILWP